MQGLYHQQQYSPRTARRSGGCLGIVPVASPWVPGLNCFRAWLFFQGLGFRAELFRVGRELGILKIPYLGAFAMRTSLGPC